MRTIFRVVVGLLLPALFLGACASAPAAAPAARAASAESPLDLSEWRPPPGQNCGAAESDPLPPFAVVFDSVAIVRAVSSIRASGALLASAGMDTLGVPELFWTIETTLPDDAARMVEDTLRTYFHGGVIREGGTGMRVRVDLREGEEPRIRTAGRQFCRPVLGNAREIQRYLEDASVRAGRTGQVVLSAFVLEDGTVGQARIHEGSQYDFLDAIAVGIATQMKFHPARIDRKPVPVWVQVPFAFQVR